MKRSLTILAALAILVTASSAFGQAQFGWTISGSSANPDANTGAATNTVATLYLWLQCGTGQGMASAEFDLGTGGSMSVLAFTALNGFLNAGGATNLLLAVGGCPNGPVVAGSVLVLDLPGDVCIVPAAANGNNVTVECGTLALIANDYRGYANLGPPCDSTPSVTLCDIYAVEDDSWGSIKSLYR
jgi:hypothetical protein